MEVTPDGTKSVTVSGEPDLFDTELGEVTPTDQESVTTDTCIRAFRRRVAMNAGTSAMKSPCPWTIAGTRPSRRGQRLGMRS